VIGGSALVVIEYTDPDMRFATILNLQDEAIFMAIVDGAAFQIGYSASFEYAEETVWAEN
jgi:hypothetical protein